MHPHDPAYEPCAMTEALTEAYETDDILLVSLLKSLADDEKIGGLLDAIAYEYVHGIRGTVRHWIDNVVSDQVAENVAAHNAKCQLERGGY